MIPLNSEDWRGTMLTAYIAAFIGVALILCAFEMAWEAIRSR